MFNDEFWLRCRSQKSNPPRHLGEISHRTRHAGMSGGDHLSETRHRHVSTGRAGHYPGGIDRPRLCGVISTQAANCHARNIRTTDAMSEIKFACPHCRQHIACDNGYAGLDVECPSCGGMMVVPRLTVPGALHTGTVLVASTPSLAPRPVPQVPRLDTWSRSQWQQHYD